MIIFAAYCCGVCHVHQSTTWRVELVCGLYLDDLCICKENFTITHDAFFLLWILSVLSEMSHFLSLFQWENFDDFLLKNIGNVHLRMHFHLKVPFQGDIKNTDTNLYSALKLVGCWIRFTWLLHEKIDAAGLACIFSVLWMNINSCCAICHKVMLWKAAGSTCASDSFFFPLTKT